MRLCIGQRLSHQDFKSISANRTSFSRLFIVASEYWFDYQTLIIQIKSATLFSRGQLYKERFWESLIPTYSTIYVWISLWLLNHSLLRGVSISTFFSLHSTFKLSLVIFWVPVPRSSPYGYVPRAVQTLSAVRSTNKQVLFAWHSIPCTEYEMWKASTKVMARDRQSRRELSLVSLKRSIVLEEVPIMS